MIGVKHTSTLNFSYILFNAATLKLSDSLCYYNFVFFRQFMVNTASKLSTVINVSEKVFLAVLTLATNELMQHGFASAMIVQFLT